MAKKKPKLLVDILAALELIDVDNVDAPSALPRSENYFVVGQASDMVKKLIGYKRSIMKEIDDFERARVRGMLHDFADNSVDVLYDKGFGEVLRYTVSLLEHYMESAGDPEQLLNENTLGVVNGLIKGEILGLFPELNAPEATGFVIDENWCVGYLKDSVAPEAFAPHLRPEPKPASSPTSFMLQMLMPDGSSKSVSLDDLRHFHPELADVISKIVSRSGVHGDEMDHFGGHLGGMSEVLDIIRRASGRGTH